MTSRTKLAALLAFALTTFAGVGLSSAGPLRGRVLDAKTRQPVSGVVVTFVWVRHVWLPDGTQSEEQFHKAFETTTDAQGRWMLPNAADQLANPDVELESPALVFFKPGYVHWGDKTENGNDLFRDPTITLMKRRTELTEQEQRDVAGDDPAWQLATDPIVPVSAIPLLVKALNEERRRQGLPSLPDTKRGR